MEIYVVEANLHGMVRLVSDSGEVLLVDEKALPEKVSLGAVFTLREGEFHPNVQEETKRKQQFSDLMKQINWQDAPE